MQNCKENYFDTVHSVQHFMLLIIKKPTTFMYEPYKIYIEFVKFTIIIYIIFVCMYGIWFFSDKLQR